VNQRSAAALDPGGRLGASAADHSRWIVRPVERPHAALRLFCFSHAGVGASAYRDWARMVPQEVELFAVQLPGRESRLREQCVTTIADAVGGVLCAFESLLDRPFALFGHSLGALLAFETARQLAHDGGPKPLHLFASGRRAPHLPGRHAPIVPLDRHAFIEEITRRYEGIPPQVLREPELLDLMLPALRADMTMLETYTFADRPPLSCPITAYAGSDDHEVHREELLAWRVHTRSAFDYRIFPGSHFFIQSARAALVADVAAILRRLAVGGQQRAER
jgi:medium-chain acyl-[acyl-carrier-protein] hydrolase